MRIIDFKNHLLVAYAKNLTIFIVGMNWVVMNHECVMCALAKKKHHVRYIMLSILYNFL